MNITLNGITIKDIQSFSIIGNCEVTIEFEANHSYSLREFQTLIENLNPENCNYFFNGVSAWNMEDYSEESIGRTDILLCTHSPKVLINC